MTCATHSPVEKAIQPYTIPMLTGLETLSVALTVAYARLSDASFLVACLPDAESVVATADAASWNQRPKLAFLSGTLRVTLTVVERKPEQSVTFQMLAEGSGASSTTHTTLTFRGIDDTTEIAWTADTVAVTGLLKIVPRTVLQAATQKIIAEVWLAIQAQFAATDPTP